MLDDMVEIIPPSPTPVTTHVLWESVVGSQLEELLYGLLEELGAVELTWRAGSDKGVNSADGGRDLEAVFDRPTPDGELDRQRWWVEAKGRSSTIAKDDVQASIWNAAGRQDVDVLVFCTNSRFSNPTRDWVTEWEATHPRPKIRLWDRDRLSKLVRDHPTVAARVLPSALEDAQRLTLLVERFRMLGETPTELDMEYFWTQSDLVSSAGECIAAISMFSYAESRDGLVERPWASLIPESVDATVDTFIEAIITLPLLYGKKRTRPLGNAKMIETAAYLLQAIFNRFDPTLLYAMLYKPAGVVKEGRFTKMAGSPEGAAKWRGFIIDPIITRLQTELEYVCAADCVRVDSEPGIFGLPLVGGRYWRQFGVGESIKEEGRLKTELFGQPCTVGLDLDSEHTCPLLKKPELSVDRIQELQEVISFRRAHSEGRQSSKVRQLTPRFDKFFDDIMDKFLKDKDIFNEVFNLDRLVEQSESKPTE